VLPMPCAARRGRPAALGTQASQRTQHGARSTAHRARCTKHEAPSTKHRTKH